MLVDHAPCLGIIHLTSRSLGWHRNLAADLLLFAIPVNLPVVWGKFLGFGGQSGYCVVPVCSVKAPEWALKVTMSFPSGGFIGASQAQAKPI